MKKTQKPQFDDDDGRTIVNMNVDGMPWYNRRRDFGAVPDRETSQPSPYGTGMTDREFSLYTWGAIKAGLVIALVFAVTWALLILFMTQILFR